MFHDERDEKSIESFGAAIAVVALVCALGALWVSILVNT